MHRRESYIPVATPRRRVVRRRTVTLGVALTAALGIAAASSVMATAHDRPRPMQRSWAASWTLPPIERPVPDVVEPTTATHRFGWAFRSRTLGTPPTEAPTDSATPTADATPSESTTPTATASAGESATASASASASATAAGAGAAGTIDRLFAASSPWNTPIAADAATDGQSSQIVSNVLDNHSLVMNLNLYAFGIPFYTATASTPRVQLGGNNPTGAVPVDPSWTPNEGGDHKMNVIDPTTQTVYELQGYDAGARTVQWAVKKNYVTSLADGFPEDGGQAGPTGSGLTQSGGVVRMSEIASGRIDHALSFITSAPVSGFRYPASHSDGEGGGIGLQEGMRIQLDPTLDVDAIPGITPGEKAIAKALQVYGAYCTDTGRGNNQAMGFYMEKPKAGDADPYGAAGFSQDWAQLPHIPRDRLRVLAADATPRP